MIAPDTTHTDRKAAAEDYLADLLLPISVSGLTIPSRQILDPVAQESYFMQHLQGLNITFLPQQFNFIQLHRRDHSPPPCPWMVPPTSLHLPIHVPGCLYKPPDLPLPPEVCLKPPYLECCVDNLVLYCCLSDLAQLSFHWIPGHCNICPNEITDLLAKTSDNIPSSTLPLGLSAYIRNSLLLKEVLCQARQRPPSLISS